MNPFRNAYLQELSANQKKIDKNKNNKIDAHDFKLLRKEEEEVAEGAVPAHMQGKQKPYVSSDGKGNYEVLGNTGQTKAEFSRKEHGKDAQSKAQAHLKSKYNDYMKEEALEEAKPGLYANINAKRKRIEAGSNERMRKPGSEGAPSAKDFKDAAKTVKEEVLDEANHREFASQGKMHPDMAKHMKTGEHMDYYEPKTGDKVHGKVMKNDGKEVHVKQTHDSYNPKKVGSVHKFTVSSKLDEKKEYPPFDGPYTKVKDTVTDKSGAKHTPMSRAKHLAQQAAIAIAKKKVKEEFDMDITTEQALELLEAVKKQDIPAFLRKARGDKPLNLDDLKKNDSLSDKNNLAKARGVKEEVEELDELSKTTIGSYVKKAKSSIIGNAQVTGMDSAGAKSKERAEKKVQKRASGINKAVDRLTKEEVVVEASVKTAYANATVIKSKNGKSIGEIYHDKPYGWGAHHYATGIGGDSMSSREQALQHLKDVHDESSTSKSGRVVKSKSKLAKEEHMNSFKSYMQEDLDEAMWPGTPEYKKKFGDTPSRGKVGTSSTTAKGTQTVTKTGVKHERDYEKAEKETSQPESGEKRGRGRPKGAASGARQKGSAAKADDRYDSTGFKLHLPNKNR
jgi:hypothetical protein